MPRKIVDFSARSKIIQQEPFDLHFWECSPLEYLDYLRNPRGPGTQHGADLLKGLRSEKSGRCQ